MLLLLLLLSLLLQLLLLLLRCHVCITSPLDLLKLSTLWQPRHNSSQTSSCSLGQGHGQGICR